MRMPTLEEALTWAQNEARRSPNEPTQQRLYLLQLLHHIKALERQLTNEPQRKESIWPHNKTP